MNKNDNLEYQVYITALAHADDGFNVVMYTSAKADMLEIPTPDNDDHACFYLVLYPAELNTLKRHNIINVNNMWSPDRQQPLAEIPIFRTCQGCGQLRKILPNPGDAGYGEHANCDYPWIKP